MDFRILGPFEVVVDGRPVNLGRPKQRAVLAVLAVNANRTVSLERLVDEVWGEDPPAHAIGSLQAYVSHLRRLLEPARAARSPARVLVSQPPGYRLVLSPDDLDVTRFETLAVDGRQLLDAGEADRAAEVSAQALALWRGDVLADFPDATFARPERERLNRVRLSTLEDRITADLTVGRHAAVVTELDRLAAAHPYRESLHGLRMLALYRCGRQAEALDSYRETCRVLREDLGVDPDPQLESLYRQILHHAPELGRASVPRTAPPGPVPVEDEEYPFVGRVGEIESLERAVDRAVAGQGRLVLLSGEPGVGKTRLAEELARRSTGVAVAWGRCEEEPGSPPFWPWAQVLRALLADVPADRRQDLLAPDRADLDGVLAGPTGMSGLPAPPVVDVEAVRFRFCRAVAGLLGRLATERPLLIVVDDMQWADVGSLRLLPVLAAEVGRAPILVLAACRHPDAGLVGTYAALARLPAVTRVALPGLDRADVRDLMAATLGAETDDGLAGEVHDRSGGNAFFVVELVRLFADRRGPAGDGVPVGVRDVLRRRLAGMPEQTRAVLLVAAVVGREFDLDVVRDASGLSDEATLDAVEAALMAGLVTEDPTEHHPADESAGRFRFGHALVRDAIYHEVSRARRARLHARVGEVLDGRPGGAARAGVHWWLAAPVVGAATAVPHLLAAAEHATAVLAHEPAEQHLRHALRLITGESPSADRLRRELDVQMRLGILFAQLHGAQSGDARAAVTRARELAEELDDGPATIAAYRSLYEVAVARAEHTHAGELAGRMLDISRRLADPVLQAVAHLAVGRTAWCRGEPATARQHLEWSLALAASAPEPSYEPFPVDVTVRLQLAPVLDLLGDGAAATAEVDAAIAGARGLAPLVRAGVFTSAALIGALRRDTVAAGAHADRALELAGPLPAWFSYASAVRSWVRAMEGDPTGGAHALHASLAQIRSRGAVHLVPWSMALLAEAETLCGRSEEAVRLLDEALDLVRQTGESMYEAELHRLRGSALLVAAPPQAVDALRTAAAVARRQGAVLLARRADEDLLGLEG